MNAMSFRNTRLGTSIVSFPIVFALFFAASVPSVFAQDDGKAPKFERHGRKYKAPPQTSNIEVTVFRGSSQKPVESAAVIFHPVDADGKDEGFLELKTTPEGTAKIDVIPTGSNVRIQVIAPGFAPYAEDYKINEPQREIAIHMQRPREQVSTYVDQSGKPASTKPGVQEPVRPKLDKNGNPIAGTAQTAPSTSGPLNQK